MCKPLHSMHNVVFKPPQCTNISRGAGRERRNEGLKEYVSNTQFMLYLCAAAAPKPHATIGPLRRQAHTPATTRLPRRRLSYYISACDCVNVCVCVHSHAVHCVYLDAKCIVAKVQLS